MKRYSAVIIGLGRMGFGYDLQSKKEEFFSHAKAILNNDEFELIAGIDSDVSRQNQFKEYSRKPVYSSVGEMKKSVSQIDLIVIATPTNTHLDVLNQALEFNPRAILLEKPIASKFEEAQEVVKLCEKNNIGLLINYVRRFEPTFHKICQQIRAEQFGKPITSNIYYPAGLLENASHFISLVVDWFGEPLELEILKPQPLQTRQHDLNINFGMIYKDHRVNFSCGNEKFFSIGEIDLIFEKNRIRFLQFGEEFEQSGIQVGKRNTNRIVQEGSIVQTEMHRYQQHVYQHLLHCMQTNSGFVESYSNALKTLKVCDDLKKLSMEKV